MDKQEIIEAAISFLVKHIEQAEDHLDIELNEEEVKALEEEIYENKPFRSVAVDTIKTME